MISDLWCYYYNCLESKEPHPFKTTNVIHKCVSWLFVQPGSPLSLSLFLGLPIPWDTTILRFSSVQFSRSVVSDSLRPHVLQHARPPCPSPTPGVKLQTQTLDPNSCPLSRWCHPTISSFVVPFSSCPQSFPASGSFHRSQLFASGGQSTGVTASTSVLPMKTQDWSPLGWTGWISLHQTKMVMNSLITYRTNTGLISMVPDLLFIPQYVGLLLKATVSNKGYHQFTLNK